MTKQLFPAIAALLLAGCSAWTAIDADSKVFNETDQTATVEISLTNEDGEIVYRETITAAPRNLTYGEKIQAPAGTYIIRAQSGPHEIEETHDLGRENPSIEIFIRPDGLMIGISIT